MEAEPVWMKANIVILAGVVIGGGVLAPVLFKMSQRQALVAPFRREIAVLREDLELLREEGEQRKARPNTTGLIDGIRELLGSHETPPPTLVRFLAA